MSKKAKKAVRYLVWFVIGQAAQVVIALVAKVSYMNNPILFSIAAGFLLTVAICAGVWLAGEDSDKAKSYMDYAKEEGYK